MRPIFTQLPNDCITITAQFLNNRDFGSMRRTCRDVHQLFQHDAIMRKILFLENLEKTYQPLPFIKQVFGKYHLQNLPKIIAPLDSLDPSERDQNLVSSAHTQMKERKISIACFESERIIAIFLRLKQQISDFDHEVISSINHSYQPPDLIEGWFFYKQKPGRNRVLQITRYAEEIYLSEDRNESHTAGLLFSYYVDYLQRLIKHEDCGIVSWVTGQEGPRTVSIDGRLVSSVSLVDDFI